MGTGSKFRTVVPYNTMKPGQEGQPRDMVYQDSSNMNLYLGDVMMSNNEYHTLPNLQPGSKNSITILQTRNIIRQLVGRIKLSSDISVGDVNKYFYALDYKAHHVMEEITYRLPGSERIELDTTTQVREVLNQIECEEHKEQYRKRSGAANKYYAAGEVLYFLIPLPSLLATHVYQNQTKPFPLHLIGDNLEMTFKLANFNTGNLPIESIEIEVLYEDFPSTDLYKQSITRYFTRLPYSFSYRSDYTGVKNKRVNTLRGLRPGETSELYISYHPTATSATTPLTYGFKSGKMLPGLAVMEDTLNNETYGAKLSNIKLKYMNETFWEYKDDSHEVYDMWQSKLPSRYNNSLPTRTALSPAQGATSMDHRVLGTISTGGAVAAGNAGKIYQKGTIEYFNAKCGGPLVYPSYYYKIPLAAILDEVSKNGYVMGVDFRGVDIQIEYTVDSALPEDDLEGAAFDTTDPSYSAPMNHRKAENLTEGRLMVTQKLITVLQFEGSNSNIIQ